MSGKEIMYNDLDAKSLDALKRYEQKFIYDEDRYTTRLFSYKDHVNSMTPKFDMDYVMTNDANKQNTNTYGDDVSFTEYYDLYFDQCNYNRIPYNPKIDTMCFRDILDIIPLSDYRKNDRIFKILNKPILKYITPGQVWSLKSEVKKIIDFLIIEEIIVVKDFTNDMYASVRNRFVNILLENNVASKYYSGWSTFFIPGDIDTIASNKKYYVRFLNTSFLSLQDPRVYYEIFTVTEDVIYNTALPGDDVIISIGSEPRPFYVMTYGKKISLMKTIPHDETNQSDTSPYLMFKIEVKQYT